MTLGHGDQDRRGPHCLDRALPDQASALAAFRPAGTDLKQALRIAAAYVAVGRKTDNVEIGGKVRSRREAVIADLGG
jgi:hypothetical protein